MNTQASSLRLIKSICLVKTNVKSIACVMYEEGVTLYVMYETESK